MALESAELVECRACAPLIVSAGERYSTWGPIYPRVMAQDDAALGTCAAGGSPNRSLPHEKEFDIAFGEDALRTEGVLRPASIPAVRVLPMNLNEFPGYAAIQTLQTGYFMKELPKSNQGYFWYRTRGLSAEPGTKVLFQCGNRIIASATFVKAERFRKPQNGYSGRLLFDSSSIQIFDPVEAARLRHVWPGLTRLSHTKYKLDPSRYSTFERMLTGVSPQSHAEKIMAAVARITAPDGQKNFSRSDIRLEAGIDPKTWTASFGPIFQGMRADQPGGAPMVADKFRNVFCRLSRDRHSLTDYGRELLFPGMSPDGPATRQLALASEDLDKAGFFSPKGMFDQRDRQMRAVVQRRGQPGFRRKLIAAYGACAVTGYNAPAALEAAHIVPYSGPKSDHVCNGLLLRSDIHTLFDLGLLSIHPTRLTVVLADTLRESSYSDLHGKKLALPKKPEWRPNSKALGLRWAQTDIETICR